MDYQARRRPDVKAVQWTGKNIREMKEWLGLPKGIEALLSETPLGHWVIAVRGSTVLKTMPPERFHDFYEPKVTFEGGTPLSQQFGHLLPDDALVAAIDMQKMLNVVASRIHEIVKKPTFPAPATRIGGRRVWWRDEVLEWKKDRDVNPFVVAWRAKQDEIALALAGQAPCCEHVKQKVA